MHLKNSLWLGLPLACMVAFSPPLTAPTYAQKLTTTRLPDGTGTIGLPPGWKIVSAYRGSVDCTGPQGAMVRLGVPWAITCPIDPSTGMPTIAAGQAPTANVGDLNGALREVLQKNGSRLVKLSRRTARPSFPGVPAYNMCYDFTGGGKTYTGVGYFTTLAYGQSSPVWSLYVSAVIAPKAVFWKQFPTMVKVWSSWCPNGKTPDAGSASALTDSIIKQRWDSTEKNHLYFREYVLGDPKK